MDKPLNKECAILVLSCDKYSSLWNPFFSQFNKFWGDCPYQVYLGNNLRRFHYQNVKVIHSGKYIDWSANLLSILGQINEDYIFVWLEDLLLTDKVDVRKFERCFNFLQRKNANHIHFEPTIGPDRYVGNGKFGEYAKGSPYRVSTVGFWKRDHLKNLLLPGESPWQFEIFGSYRSAFFEGYYCYAEPLFKYIQLVERGKLFREGYLYCQRNNINIDLNTWDIHTQLHKLKSDINRKFFNVIIKVPWKKRLAVINFFRKLFASY